MVQCLSLLDSFPKLSPSPGSDHCRFVQTFDKDLKRIKLFRLLEKETLKIFSVQERHKRRHKFGGTNVCKSEEVRNYFVNPKSEIEVLS